MTQHFENNAKVLTFGDGLGFDSFYLAEAGYCVDYFEVSKRGIQFAQPMFSKYGLSVNMISDREGLRPGSYDVVVCLDVLEHVPCPADLVKLFSELLKDQGVLISHAPFWYLAPEVVTHLRSNRRHSGSFRLYREHGLRAVDGAWFWNPVVFRKTKTRDSFDFIPISAKARLWLGGTLLSLGRVWSWPFVTGARALFRSKPQRWRRTTTITGTDHVT